MPPMWGQIFKLPPAFQPAFFGGRETPGTGWNADGKTVGATGAF